MAAAACRLRCPRAGLPAQHSGAAWTWAWIFLAGTAQRGVGTAIHFFAESLSVPHHVSVIYMCCSAFCVSTFVFGTQHWEFPAIQMRAFSRLRACPAIFVWSPPHTCQSDRCVAQLFAFLELHHAYLCAESWLQKRKREFAKTTTSRN